MPTKKHAYAGLSPSENHASQGKNVRTNTRNSAFPRALLVLYKTLIRPILDYGNLIWFPTLKKDIRAIENVQRRVTKILPQLSNLCYEERLKKLSLSTLMYRRNRMDMIQVFKIVQNIDDISMNGLFEFSDTQTRGNSKKAVARGTDPYS